MVVNENLYLARSRDSQLKLQLGTHGSLGELIGTFVQNDTKDTQKVMQDMLVL